MPAGNTYTPIQTYTLGSNTTVTFSSIPQTYTDLILVTSVTGTTNGAMDVRFNGDTATNYRRNGMYGDGTTASAYNNPSLAYGLIGAGAGSARSISITHFMGYSNASIYKTYITQDSTASATGVACYLWKSSAPINTIALTGDPIGSNIGAGSTLTLYGVTAA